MDVTSPIWLNDACYFGDLWKPVFKQWFEDKTNMGYKTLSLN